MKTGQERICENCGHYLPNPFPRAPTGDRPGEKNSVGAAIFVGRYVPVVKGPGDMTTGAEYTQRDAKCLRGHGGETRMEVKVNVDHLCTSIN